MSKAYSNILHDAKKAAMNFAEDAGDEIEGVITESMRSFRRMGINDKDMFHAATIQILANALREAIKVHNLKSDLRLPNFKVIKQRRKE